MNGDLIVGKHRFELRDGGDEEHPGAERRGARKSLAVPAEMFSHPPELPAAPLSFKYSCVLQQHAEPRCKVWCPRGPRQRPIRLDTVPSLFLVSKEPRSP